MYRLKFSIEDQLSYILSVHNYLLVQFCKVEVSVIDNVKITVLQKELSTNMYVLSR